MNIVSPAAAADGREVEMCLFVLVLDQPVANVVLCPPFYPRGETVSDGHTAKAWRGHFPGFWWIFIMSY